MSDSGLLIAKLQRIIHRQRNHIQRLRELAHISNQVITKLEHQHQIDLQLVDQNRKLIESNRSLRERNFGLEALHHISEV